MEEEIYHSEYDDSMDGDHDSCMNSIGWGDDDAYGSCNEEDY